MVQALINAYQKGMVMHTVTFARHESGFWLRIDLERMERENLKFRLLGKKYWQWQPEPVHWTRSVWNFNWIFESCVRIWFIRGYCAKCFGNRTWKSISNDERYREVKSKLQVTQRPRIFLLEKTRTAFGNVPKAPCMYLKPDTKCDAEFNNVIM